MASAQPRLLSHIALSVRLWFFPAMEIRTEHTQIDSFKSTLLSITRYPQHNIDNMINSDTLTKLNGPSTGQDFAKPKGTTDPKVVTVVRGPVVDK